MKQLKMICLAAALLLTPALAMAAPAQSLSQSQIEDIVRKLLTEKEPELVIKAAKAYQEQEEENALKRAQTALDKQAKNIYKDPNSPVAGNPKGDVTVIEFFDYACGYCKKVQSTVTKLLKEDKNVRFVFKELPIFGPASISVSKAALAAARQGQDKYFDFHMALMGSEQRLTEKRTMAIAKKVGLDVKKLKKDMQDPKIASIIEDNQKLAADLSIQGTPAFIIGKTILPGAVPYEKIKEEIASLRAAKK